MCCRLVNVYTRVISLAHVPYFMSQKGSLATALEERTGAGAADNKNFSKRSSDGQCVQGGSISLV